MPETLIAITGIFDYPQLVRSWYSVSIPGPDILTKQQVELYAVEKAG